MELHRSGRNDRKLSLVGIVYGLASIAVGAVFAVLGGGAVTVFLCGTGGFVILAGVIVLLSRLRRFQIAFSESGLTIHTEGLDFEGRWDMVLAINVEQTTIGQSLEARTFLVLWLADTVPMRRAPTFPPNGTRKGYVVVELINLKETPEQVAAVLAEYAGNRFRTMAQV